MLNISLYVKHYIHFYINLCKNIYINLYINLYKTHLGKALTVGILRDSTNFSLEFTGTDRGVDSDSG